ncbi:MlaD family protein [Nocardia stercoris]|uniref:MCE family protein n=1 Tax=Nocardia stercoris TaxID=2483361 RepID=A0A3M2KWV9_9NOCA|nr:MlaD family protein [Nocardia stercoris]RMI30042.1 MCE family protein [Nocardia stercoris]
MLERVLRSRGAMSATVIVTLVLAGAAGLKLGRPDPPTRAYCAEMPDSIGLYRGSAVTVMGVQVGRVTDIRPDGATALVRFTVRADRKLPADVGAVTVSDTLIADRNLALVGDEPSGPGWDPGHCITKTLTPKSMSETFAALAALADRLDGAGDSAQRTALGDGLDALDRATTGTGDSINAVVNQLSRALAAPDAGIGHLGELLDALAELAHRARGGWSNIEDTVTGLTQAFADIDYIAFPPIIRLVANLDGLLPAANDLMVMFGSPALRGLDSTRNLAHLIAADIGSLSEIVALAPAIAAGFTASIDPGTGQPSIGYAPPRVALPQPQADGICAVLQSVTGEGCRSAADGAVAVPALPALLGAVSGR